METKEAKELFDLTKKHSNSEFSAKKKVILLLCGSFLFWNDLLEKPLDLIKEAKINLNRSQQKFVTEKLESLTFKTKFSVIKSTLTEIFEKVQIENPLLHLSANIKQKINSLEAKDLNSIFSQADLPPNKEYYCSWINSYIRHTKKESSNIDSSNLKEKMLLHIKKQAIIKEIEHQIANNSSANAVAKTLLNNLDICKEKVSDILQPKGYRK